jgi:hypothetical protein
MAGDPLVGLYAGAFKASEQCSFGVAGRRGDDGHVAAARDAIAATTTWADRRDGGPFREGLRTPRSRTFARRKIGATKGEFALGAYQAIHLLRRPARALGFPVDGRRSRCTPWLASIRWLVGPRSTTGLVASRFIPSIFSSPRRRRR